MQKEEEDIHQIIEGCKKNDRKAQELLYRHYYRAMMTLCLYYTKNEADALEVLNTGFHNAYKNIHGFDDTKAGIYTWLRIIIVNSCLDLIKVKQATTEELNEAQDVHVSPDVIAHMSALEILKLVRELPPATRAVFNLYVVEGYNHSEIAAITGISEGTSKWHLSEARKKLQKMITGQKN